MMRARTGSRSFCGASLLALVWPLMVAAAEETPRAVELSGTVPAALSRPLAPAANEEMAKLLKPYDIPAAEFKWQMKPVPTSDVPVYNVTFPSPLVTAAACNNTVHCEYFTAQKDGRRPAVIVLHILNGNFVAERLVCGYLAADGTNALLLKMPYYGPRRPPEWKGQMSDDIEMLAGGMQQAVMDVRRAAAWLSSRPEVDPEAIGLCGISLGGFVAATAAGVDGRFGRVVVVIGGGNLIEVIENRSREVEGLVQAAAKRGIDAAKMKALLAPVEPLAYASRLKNTKVLMIASTADEVVPAACTEALAKASSATLKWYEATHYTLVLFLPVLLQDVAAHFSVEK